MRGWVEDEEEEGERHQQPRQQKRRSQVQLEEAALEGAAGEPAGREAPQEVVQAVEGAGVRGGPLGHGWRKAYTVSHPASTTIDSLEWTAWLSWVG